MQNSDDAIEITRQAYQRIAPIYAANHVIANAPVFWQTCMQRFAAVVRENIAYQEHPELPIVDVGCGPGRDSLLLAQMGFPVIATDISDAMLEEARRRCEDQPGAERITFRRMDMRSLDFPDAFCAGLWASASFLHIPKRENRDVLREFRRVLIPNGALMLLVKESDEGADERYDIHQPSGERRFFARYHGSELWELLEQAGFLVIEILTDRDRRFANLQRWLGATSVKL